jgi:periplasmic divalent cation tolerance protein
LAACVNMIPGISSVYVWEGKVEKDAEILLMIKTRTSGVPRDGILAKYKCSIQTSI